jgi:hypothetical protein
VIDLAKETANQDYGEIPVRNPVTSKINNPTLSSMAVDR